MHPVSPHQQGRIATRFPMKSSTTPPVKVPPIEGETDTEYLLRLAAEFITAYANENEVLHAHYGDDHAVTGEELADSLSREAEEMAEERATKGRGISLVATLVQAGGPASSATMTFTATSMELQRCGSLPFYKPSQLFITPIRP